MPDDQLSDAAAIAAYQDVTLTELGSLFAELDFDLTDILEREARISDALDGVDSELDAVRARLAAMGVSVPAAIPMAEDVATAGGEARRRPRYDVPLVPAEADFDKLITLATVRLEQLGIDLTKDPLQQVIPGSEIARSLRAYSDEHGDISWDETDWVVVLGAGVLATLVDIVLVGIPRDTILRDGSKHAGSPITKWLNEKSPEIHKEFLKPLEKLAKVPYDANHTTATGGRVSMGPRNHRLKSLGHDPLLGFLYGVRDIMQASGTYIDKGKLVQVPTELDPVGLIEALLTQVRHLLSDVATPGGLPAPLFTLLQFSDFESPFIRTRGGVEVKATWVEISQYMYLNGYDLRHFFTMGITPAIVSVVIRGYWLLKSYGTGGSREQRQKEHVKLTSMLLLGHSIATSGTLLKTGVFYGMNPLALNYSQVLAMAPVTTAWFKEAIARDHRISHALEREWHELLDQSGGHPSTMGDQATGVITR
jgi:hypothetical protein